MESINLLHCKDRSADYSNRRSYLLFRRQADTASCNVRKSVKTPAPSFFVAGQFAST
jgi:hypothetical protein